MAVRDRRRCWLLVAALTGSEDKKTLDAEGNPLPPPSWYSLHFQFTAATQYHPAFDAKYTGRNSLSPDAESATAFVSTLYGDVRLWRGGELLLNPEMSGGRGLSSTLGVAAFPDGIVYRVGEQYLPEAEEKLD